MPAESFPTDPTGLPEAARPPLLELADGDAFDLRIGAVAKRLGDITVRMLGYNGSIPGPTLKVQQGSEVIVHVINDGDLEATVHWHGLRLENKYDGVPHETQTPAATSPTGSGSPTRACTGITRTSARTTPRRWACTATSWLSRPTRATGHRPTGTCC
jgi:hypothetical protein